MLVVVMVLMMAGGVVGGIAGCAGPGKKMRERLGLLADARLDRTIHESIAAAGGVEAWAEVCRIDGEALATVFTDGAGELLLEQHHHIIPGERAVITLTSKEPDGVLIEQFDHDGQISIILQGAEEPTGRIDPMEQYGAAVKMRLLIQALTGPVGLLQEGLHLRYSGVERKGNRLAHKIEVTGELLDQAKPAGSGGGDLLLVWIDAETHLPERLWLRYPLGKGQFGYLAANVHDYRAVAGGLVLPGRVEFVRSDEYQQFSRQNIMLVEYQQFKVTRRQKGKSPLLAWF